MGHKKKGKNVAVFLSSIGATLIDRLQYYYYYYYFILEIVIFTGKSIYKRETFSSRNIGLGIE